MGCEMLRIPHCLDNWLTDGGKAVSLTIQPCFTPLKYFLVLTSVRGCIYPMAIVWLKGLDKLKKFRDFTATEVRDLPASTIVPQPRALPRNKDRVETSPQFN
jgi:hypothetical protein